MAASEVWNVFLPFDLLKYPSPYLIGHIDKSKSSVYVIDTCSTYMNRENESIIGSFTSSKMPAALAKRTVRLSVSRSSGTSPKCSIHLSGKVDPCKCVCVLFDPSDFLSSYILADENETHTNVESHLGSLFAVYHGKWTPEGTEQTNTNFRVKVNSKPLLERVFSLCLYILTVAFTVTELLLCAVSFQWCWSYVSVQSPAVISHITNKLNRFKRVQSHHRSKLILYDVCGQQVLDSVLGMVFMLYVIGNGQADIIATSIMHWAHDTANNLNDLLHWLMGAPAGLKLNAQLTEYMGHFFLYHVYLWSGYLSLLRPTLGWVIWTAAGFGTLGLSTQLCLVQDIISMLTLHIYCFYVYAARLYCLQIYALASLWRLFRGKKWNVLRLRVDSALYNIDQLCVGTLLFTVLLFLLPTTLLYYFVFTALRLLVLSFHGLLTTVIDGMNSIPVVTVFLRLFKTKSIAGDLLFAVIQDTEKTDTDNCLTLSMQTTHLPMLTLYRRAQVHMKTEQPQQKYSWKELFQRLVSGNLVYPWINSYDSDTKEKLL